MSINSWENISNYKTHALPDQLLWGMLAKTWMLNNCRAGQDWNGTMGSRVVPSGGLTDAFPLVCHSNWPTKETGSSSQVAGAGVDDPVVPTQVLLRRSHLWADPITRHAVRVVCLVYDARGTAGAQDIAAGFWKSKNSCGCDWNTQKGINIWLMRGNGTLNVSYSCIFPGTVHPGQGVLCI